MKRAARSGCIALAALAPWACSEHAPPQDAPAGVTSTLPQGPALAPRLAALRALAEAQAPSPLEPPKAAELAQLIDAAYLPESDEWLASRAEERLLRDPDAVTALEAGLAHSHPAVRSRCAWQLGQLGMARSQPPLLWRLRQEVQPAVRLWMADALVRQKNHSCLLDVCTLFRNPELAQDAAETAFVALADAGVSLADSPSWDELEARLRGLHTYWLEHGAPQLAEGVEPPRMDEALEGRVAEHLASLVEFQLRPVDEARTVLTRLGSLPVPLLRLACTAEERYLRVHAVEILRDLGPPGRAACDVILPLIQDPPARLGAIQALGAIGCQEACDPLLALLRGTDPEARAAAASALGPLGDARAVQPLRELLRAPDASLDDRVYAAFSLALLEGGGEGRAFLEERQARGDYHAPTLEELLDRLGPAPGAGG